MHATAANYSPATKHKQLVASQNSGSFVSSSRTGRLGVPDEDGSRARISIEAAVLRSPSGSPSSGGPVPSREVLDFRLKGKEQRGFSF